MAGEKKASDLVKTHIAEAIKQYFEYDGSDRMVVVYSASTGALHGESCGKTEYAYDGGSTRVIKMKESLATWDEAWDI